jgi:hypothetical protein
MPERINVSNTKLLLQFVFQDSVRQETVPFGNNRTIANGRRIWMDGRGELDPRDIAEHREEKDKKKASFSTKFAGYNSTNNDDNCLGKECWLMFVAFDVS